MLNARFDTRAGQDWNERLDSSGALSMRRRTKPATATDIRAKSMRSADVAAVVFVIDDDVSVRESLHALIRSAGMHVETFTCAHEFLARPRVFAPSCLILDVSLPDLNGLDLQKRVTTQRADMPIIFITGHVDVAMTVQAMKAGALEFLMKPFRDDVLLRAIEDGVERSRTALREEATMQVLRDCHATLTRREQEVMTLVVAGLLNKQVAGELGISEITVKAHRGKLMRKMDADSLAALVAMAARLGFVPASSRRRNGRE
jgi:FixJ family two-component response regulator